MFTIGDGAGVTRGLIQASASGVIVAREILKREHLGRNMGAIAQEIRCSHCGAPVEFKPGEIIATCKYCGFTTVIETGQTFTFEHSLILNKFDPKTIDDPIHNWMSSGFLKPGDLSKNQR